MAKMKCLVFKVVGFHLNCEVIHTKTIVKLGAQLPQQVGLRDGFSSESRVRLKLLARTLWSKREGRARRQRLECLKWHLQPQPD